MNRKQTTEPPTRTPHLDPLPLGRGEEKEARVPRPTNATNASDRGLLSPLGGGGQGEGAGVRSNTFARLLRRRSTWAEKTLWNRLRNRRLGSFKFRRQHPVGHYDLDFYCAEARLAVELDGKEHGHPERQASDHERDAFLARPGIKVIRFWNHSVRENLRSVLDTILRELAERTPHLDPLPFGRGEEKETGAPRPTSATNASDRGLLSPLWERIKVRGPAFGQTHSHDLYPNPGRSPYSANPF